MLHSADKDMTCWLDAVTMLAQHERAVVRHRVACTLLNYSECISATASSHAICRSIGLIAIQHSADPVGKVRAAFARLASATYPYLITAPRLLESTDDPTQNTVARPVSHTLLADLLVLPPGPAITMSHVHGTLSAYSAGFAFAANTEPAVMLADEQKSTAMSGPNPLLHDSVELDSPGEPSSMRTRLLQHALAASTIQLPVSSAVPPPDLHGSSSTAAKLEVKGSPSVVPAIPASIPSQLTAVLTEVKSAISGSKDSAVAPSTSAPAPVQRTHHPSESPLQVYQQGSLARASVSAVSCTRRILWDQQLAQRWLLIDCAKMLVRARLRGPFGGGSPVDTVSFIAKLLDSYNAVTVGPSPTSQAHTLALVQRLDDLHLFVDALYKVRALPPSAGPPFSVVDVISCLGSVSAVDAKRS